MSKKTVHITDEQIEMLLDLLNRIPVQPPSLKDKAECILSLIEARDTTLATKKK